MRKVFQLFFRDLLLNNVIIGFTVVLFLITAGLFSMESRPEKAFTSVVTVVIMLVPVVNLLFASNYYYGTRDFNSLLLSGPLPRRRLILGLWSSLSAVMVITFVIGIGVPSLMFYPSVATGYLFIAGILLSLVFTSFGLWIAVRFRNRLTGLGAVLICWLFFALVYDGLLLYILYSYSDYPLEKWMPLFIALNPIDLGRVTVLLQTDAAALLGYTGAVFKQIAGDLRGGIYAFCVLALWAVIPIPLIILSYIKKDL